MEEPYESYFGFEQLEVYKLAPVLITDVYPIVERFPKAEQFRLTHQLCRAVSSVALNIAEGKGRSTDKDFVRFLHQSRGSLLETVSALQIATMLGFLPQAERGRLVAQASRLHAKLNGLIRALG